MINHVKNDEIFVFSVHIWFYIHVSTWFYGGDEINLRIPKVHRREYPVYNSGRLKKSHFLEST